MLRSIKWFLTGSEPVEFESAYRLDESVRRLRDATRRWALFSTTEVAAGAVSSSRVSLQRVIPMVGNSFKPYFIGKFERRADKVVLVGRFTMHPFVKVFMAIWMGFVVFATLASGVAATQSHRAAPMPLFGLGMLLCGVLLVRFGAWLSRNDSAWLSDVIRRTLNSPDAISNATGPSPVRSRVIWARSVRMTTKVAIALALLAVMVSVSAVTGIQSYRAGPGGAVVTHYDDMTSRYLSGLFSVGLLGFAYGIYRRRMLAWRLVFVVIGGAWLSQLVVFFVDGTPRMPTFVLVLAGVFSALIMVVWGRWWYAQRVHFLEQ
jgi:hypothetical protein